MDLGSLGFETVCEIDVVVGASDRRSEPEVLCRFEVVPTPAMKLSEAHVTVGKLGEFAEELLAHAFGFFESTGRDEVECAVG